MCGMPARSRAFRQAVLISLTAAILNSRLKILRALICDLPIETPYRRLNCLLKSVSRFGVHPIQDVRLSDARLPLSFETLMRYVNHEAGIPHLNQCRKG